MAKPMPLPTSRIPGFTVALPMARHHRGVGVEDNWLLPPLRRSRSAVIVAASLLGKKKVREEVFFWQYRPNITTNYIRIDENLSLYRVCFSMQLFWLSFFHHPSEISGCSFWCRKNAERFIWVWSCAIRIAETAGKCVSKCPQRSVLGATCFCSWFPIPAHEYAKKCVKYILYNYIVKSK